MPADQMNGRSRVDVAPGNILKSGLFTGRYDLCVDHSRELDQIKDNCLALDAMPYSTSNTVGTEVGLIHFKRTVQRRSWFTRFSQSLTNLEVDRIHSTKGDSRDFYSHSCRQIHLKTPTGETLPC